MYSGTRKDSWITLSLSWCFFHCRLLDTMDSRNMRLRIAVAVTRLWGLTCLEGEGGGHVRG